MANSKMGWLRGKVPLARAKRRSARRRPSAQLVALCCGLLSWAAAAVALAKSEPAPEPPPLLFWGVSEDCTRSPKMEQALMAHLNRMGEHLIGCEALDKTLPALSPCSGADCEAQLPSECKQAPLRLLGAEIYKKDTVTQLHVWLAEVRPGSAAPNLRTVEDTCLSCDAKSVQELLISRAGELVEGGRPAGGMCSAQARANAADPGELEAPQVTLLVVDVADKERSVRAAVEPYLIRLGHQVVAPRRRHAKACVSQECLSMLAQSFKEQGVTQILTITNGSSADSPQIFVYDTQSHRAEQRNIDCENCGEPQLVTALVEAAGQLAVRCLRENCPHPPRAQALAGSEAACAPLPQPQCGKSVAIVKPLTNPGKPMLARRIGAGGLIGAGVAVVAGSLIWSVLSRTSLSQSLIATNACDFMSRGALPGSCQITNYGGVDIGGYFVGAAAITGGILLLKLPLERPTLVATAAERK